ncbi:cupin domain-containing protein [Cytophagaceae bacterium DM2B3-1]|uniref:Cupin domain-containing protein n=2 Tax=Xanthocytophaga TaxID=3078918 RepID=A0ABT7CKA4_9BACT|nr:MULTISPECIES: cupin domain-containing protein [Xanthocytophaga]MDJ1494125.1 cupin domain-containing protein [Xanthocytophaga flavus]MDJ1499275.1 cupin domain-containing protein [Xanthocytophaga agilis]
MSFIDLSAQSEKTIFDGFFAKFIHTDQITIAYVRIEEGKHLPPHSHPQEQITTVISGELEMTVGDKTQVLKEGQVGVIPSNVVHSGKALTPCYVIDVFNPVREDFKKL